MSEQERSDRERYGELARRLCAAYQSRQMGLASVDYTLKTYLAGEDIGEYWIALAKRVTEDMLKNQQAFIESVREK